MNKNTLLYFKVGRWHSSFICIFAVLALAAFALFLARQCKADDLSSGAPTAFSWNNNIQGNFVTAVCSGNDGTIWVAAESNGIWRYTPSDKQWFHFTYENTNGGLGDNDVYCLLCDKLGRIWCGTARHGVSVFSAYHWKTYDRLFGPMGCHTLALAQSPLTGDVWGCTETGLFRYELKSNIWRYYTTTDGLSNNQTDCLVFDKKGTIFVGTLCHGITISSPISDYKNWRSIQGPAAISDAPGGDGLPTPQLNCLFIAKSGVVYAGTTDGLARSNDAGQHWRYLKGANWRDNLSGLRHPVPPHEINTDGLLLPDNYITALAEDDYGFLYIGSRKTGISVYAEQTARFVTPPNEYDGYVQSLLLTNHGHLLIGSYGDGLQIADWIVPPAHVVATLPPKLKYVPLPTPAKAPTALQLASMLHRVQSLTLPKSTGTGCEFLGEDWQTQGDAIGRYGRQYAVYCGSNIVMTTCPYYSVSSTMGDHHASGDGLRWYLSWLQTDTVRTLYIPTFGVRRQTEWDDHGEDQAYPPNFQGPDIWIYVHLGVGNRHRLSLYFMNKDGGPGYGGDNRYRDYVIEVRRYVSTMTNSMAGPMLATARVRNFWGGVYENFSLDGPGDYAVKISRNGSHNTIISGVFIDKLSGPTKPEDTEPLAYMNGVRYEPPITPSSLTNYPSLAVDLWRALDVAEASGIYVKDDFACRLSAYRSMVAARTSADALDNWRWKMCIWNENDRDNFEKRMVHAREAGALLAQAKTPSEVAAASQTN
jgi:hypothetical protein